ncbi:MAG: YhcH/YjgK/YiaL family protein [Odoribacter sp.]|nr:YhcH/YjgK/YiaL family protein [Odoribacter sp.]
MILDKLENAACYSGISENLNIGFEFLKNTDLAALKNGKHEIRGMEIFALVNEADTKEDQECQLEAHRNYADIQYIVSGREFIGYAALNDQPVLKEYFPERDIIFFSGETKPIYLEAGMFVVFFPQDAHRPGMQVAGPEMVKKVVVKVRI